MREVVLDTETTGLKHDDGDRLVEIGCIELVDGRPTGEKFHRYMNPDREVPEEAVRVHGLTTDRLQEEPRFVEIAEDLANFLGDAQLVIHNAEFDLAFINMELRQVGRNTLEDNPVVDTLAKARRELPAKGYGGPFSLDALCKHFGIADKARGLHGALLDADLLVKVYQKLSGFEEQIGMNLAAGGASNSLMDAASQTPGNAIPPRPNPLPQQVSEEETEAHKEFVATLGRKNKKSLWKY
ncbi:MAG: DNA polymerase III subunit epsilon [Hyphomicrobiales bacterium]|nr:DNA polymerase III subunit epsilon [Hyphomicrobiales bacterium]